MQKKNQAAISIAGVAVIAGVFALTNPRRAHDVSRLKVVPKVVAPKPAAPPEEGPWPRPGIGCGTADLAGSPCAEHGACSLDEVAGACSATRDEDCARSAACRRDGRCALVVRGFCSSAGSAEVCARIGACKKEGLCAFEAPSPDEPLRTVEVFLSDSREMFEAEHWRSKGCLAATDAGCAASEACTRRGRCIRSPRGLCIRGAPR